MKTEGKREINLGFLKVNLDFVRLRRKGRSMLHDLISNSLLSSSFLLSHKENRISIKKFVENI